MRVFKANFVCSILNSLRQLSSLAGPADPKPSRKARKAITWALRRHKPRVRNQKYVRIVKKSNMGYLNV